MNLSSATSHAWVVTRERPFRYKSTNLVSFIIQTVLITDRVLTRDLRLGLTSHVLFPLMLIHPAAAKKNKKKKTLRNSYNVIDKLYTNEIVIL